MNWHHDELAADLASHLIRDGKAFAWLNIEVPGCDAGRPDVLSFPRWQYNAPRLLAFEVKVSVADLNRDLEAGKWSKYLGACGSVTFAMPSGLVKAADLPPGFGVMFRSSTGWRTQRKAPVVDKLATPAAMAKLLSSRPFRPQGGRAFDIRGYREMQILSQCEARAVAAFGARFGASAARYVAAHAKGEDPAARSIKDAQDKVATYNEHLGRIYAELAELCEVLGLPAGSDIYAIRGAVKKLAERLTLEGEAAALYRQLRYMRTALDDALALRDRAG